MIYLSVLHCYTSGYSQYRGPLISPVSKISCLSLFPGIDYLLPTDLSVCPGFVGIKIIECIFYSGKLNFWEDWSTQFGESKLIRHSSFAASHGMRVSTGIRAADPSWPTDVFDVIDIMFPINWKVCWGQSLILNAHHPQRVSLLFCSHSLLYCLLWLLHGGPLHWSCRAHSAWHALFNSGRMQVMITTSTESNFGCLILVLMLGGFLFY